MKRPIRLSMLASATVLLFLSGCHHTLKSKPLSELTPTEMQGHAIFQSDCAVCHHPNSEQKLVGPGLLGLFQKPYLPSGAPATDARVRFTILRGKNVMPPFANILNDQQLNDLLAYLHTI
ncbi:MAG TPA: cytochrome c [Acidobacteriaceae bacterium]|nr:cytochrome c [Acidobacteriaceae bacterium]